jgi:nicotinamide-nucleotide amidase
MAPQLWDQLESFGEISSLPHPLGVDIGVKIQADSLIALTEKEQKIHSIVKKSKISSSIWHIGAETIEEVIIQKAKEKNLKIGFAESCTGGLLASRITDMPGSSSIFWGSIISYSNEVKINCLDVKEKTLREFGAVSKETAFEMAIGARQKLSVDIAVSTTGIAGPGGATPGKPVGTVGIAVSTKSKTVSEMYHYNGNRTSLKYSFSQAALFQMLDAIISHE